jgi:DNA-binding PadR family transcriptional regulator
MCSHFLDAYLIRVAVKGIYQLTPKGLYILNRFVIKNNISAMHILQILTSQPKCTSLYYLDRRGEDDEPVITSASMTALFRRFAGAQPTYSLPTDKALDAFQQHRKLTNGIPVTKIRVSKKKNLVYEHCFSAVSAVEWLCEFTSTSGKEEAAQLIAHFVRYGFVELVNDERKRKECAIVYTARSFSEKNVVVAVRLLWFYLCCGCSCPSFVFRQEGQANPNAKAIYRVTDKGSRVVGWGPSVPPGMQRKFDNDQSFIGASMDSSRMVTDDQNIWNKT